MDWLAALDLNRALANCHYDVIGDWYRDPWGWPEMDWAVGNSMPLLIDRLSSQGVRPAAPIDVPKTNFATRPAIVFDPIDRLCYQALVDAISTRLIGDLPRWAYGTRLARKEPVRGLYTVRSEWKWYRERLRALVRGNSHALVTDIVSFFASIPIDSLCEAIEQRVRNDITRRVCDLLVRWSQIAGRSGLQQRALASSVLANMYLRPIDDVLSSEGGSTKPYGRAVRWTDDIWLFGSDAGELRRAQLRLESCMRDLGLELNISKTKVMEGNELVEAVFELELGYVDVSLTEEPPNAKPLELLVAKLVRQAELAPRTAIRFACTRIRRQGRRDLARQLAGLADRMPQGADHVARMLRELDLWEERADWYVAYCGSSWGALEWAPAQLGTMFPSRQGPPIVAELFAQEVALHRHALPFLALAAQRIAAWRPNAARDLIREVAKRVSHPLERRVLALAALEAGEDRQFVRGLLRQFDENKPTLLMLEATNFRPPKLVADFAG